MFELRIDTGRFAFHVPVDEHPWAAIPSMPFGHQVSIPSRELLGIGGASRGAFSPDLGEPDAEDGIGYLGNGRPHGIFGQKAVVGVEQVTVTLPMVARTRPLETDVTVMWNILNRCIN